MKLRNTIIDLIESNYGSDSILAILKIDGDYTQEDIFKSMNKKDEILDEVIVKTNYDSIKFQEWFIGKVDKLREEINSNNEFYKDISKHDIIRYKEYFQKEHVTLSNELYNLKKYVEELENDKRNLQIKLEKARICSKCVDCKDNSCLNNILYVK